MKIKLFFTGSNGLTTLKEVEVDREWLNSRILTAQFESASPAVKQTWHTAGGKVHIQVTYAGQAIILYGDENDPQQVELEAGDVAAWQDNEGGHMAEISDQGWTTLHLVLGEPLPL